MELTHELSKNVITSKLNYFKLYQIKTKEQAFMTTRKPINNFEHYIILTNILYLLIILFFLFYILIKTKL